PGFTAEVEVYHGTAPLVRATARPLTPSQFDRLRRHAAARAMGAATLAPLFDRDGWEVVGGVAAWPARAGWLSWWTALAVLLSLGAGALAAVAVGRAPGRPRRALGWYAAAAVLLGVVAFGDIRTTAEDAPDRWLDDARLLIQEAVARVPETRFSLATLGKIVRGAELMPGDSAGDAAWRRTVAGTPRAAVAVRLAPGRWAELRTVPAEAATAGWLALTLGLALLGPLGAALAAWGEREAARPQRLRETVAAWGFIAPSALHLAVFSFATMLFLPYVSSVVAIALVWQWMYNPDFGLINYLLSAAHLQPVDWLGSPRTALVAVMIVSVWAQLGYQMTVFLAGLQGVPPAYLDAARVDGASAWQRFWRITFPLLRPVTLFVLVTGIIGSFQVFTYIYVLTDGGPLHATDVIVYRIYQTAWEFLQFGYASALSLLLFVVLFAVTRAQFRLLGRQVEYA